MFNYQRLDFPEKSEQTQKSSEFFLSPERVNKKRGSDRARQIDRQIESETDGEFKALQITVSQKGNTNYKLT